jgi:proton glutamate symport protein
VRQATPRRAAAQGAISGLRMRVSRALLGVEERLRRRVVAARHEYNVGQPSMKRACLAAALAFFAFAAVISAAPQHGVLSALATAPLFLRWAGLIGLLAYAALRQSLTTWMLVSIVAGAEVGYDAPGFAVKLQFLGQIFLRLIKTVVAPLLFGTLVSGIAVHADLKKVGRMGLKALVYFELVTTAALVIGLAAIHISKAGVGVRLPGNVALTAANPQLAAERPTAAEIILHAFPENIARSVAEGQVLQVVIFSIMFAIALGMLPEARRRPLLAFAESLAETMFKFTSIVMLYAPVGVGAAVAYTVGHTGFGILLNLLKLLATLYVALIVFLLGVLLPVAALAGISLPALVRAIAEPVSIAFATSSSEAALPSALKAMESLGVPRSIAGFVIPTGYSFNLDGSTLYLSLASIFLAQAAGISMSWGRELMLMLTLMLASKGLAGVSRAAIVVLLAIAPSFGLPTEPIFILLGIDQLMDMARTSVNVIGNCLASVVVARWEGEFPSRVPAMVKADASAGCR